MGVVPGFIEERDFPAALLVAGKSGFGKSTHLRVFAERHFGRKDKIIDMMDFGRFEFATSVFPNTNLKMKRMFLHRLCNFLRRDQPGALEAFDSIVESLSDSRGYPVECYIPAVPEMPRKLPIIFRPFRIDFSTLTFDELLILLGGELSDSVEGLLATAWLEREEDGTFSDYMRHVVRIAASSVKIDGVALKLVSKASLPSALRALRRLERTAIIGDPGDPLNLDIKAIMRDTSVMSGFSYAWVDDVALPYAILAYFLRRIHNIRLFDAEHFPNLRLFFREIHKAAPSVSDFPGQRHSRKYLKAIMNEPRDLRVWTYGDTQRLNKLSIDCRLAAHTFIIHRLDAASVEALDRTLGVPKSIQWIIRNADVGVYAQYLDGWDAPLVYQPPKSLVKPFQISVLDMWKKAGGDYKTWKITVKRPAFRVELLVPDAEEEDFGGPISRAGERPPPRRKRGRPKRRLEAEV